VRSHDYHIIVNYFNLTCYALLLLFEDVHKLFKSVENIDLFKIMLFIKLTLIVFLYTKTIFIFSF